MRWALLGLGGTAIIVVAFVTAMPTAGEPRLWAIIGNEVGRDSAERDAGVNAKVVTLSWRLYEPRGTVDRRYVIRKRSEFDGLRRAGFELILGLGFNDSPAWLHDVPDSYYVDQDGHRYVAPTPGPYGDANLVFNPALRRLAAGYVRRVLADFGSDFYAVRLGGGRFGELTYPPATVQGRANRYWAFDAIATRHNPVPYWRPGGAGAPGSAGGPAAARRFLAWYLDTLTDYELWQIRTLREVWQGPIMMLFPGWGIRPGDIDRAVAARLDGSSSAERNGEIQGGRDFARQIAAVEDRGVVVTTTWLESDVYPGADDGADQGRWTPVHYLAHLAAGRPDRLRLFGENGGRDGAAAMRFAAGQMRRYGLIGMAWFREAELFSGGYATLDDYRRVIAADGSE